MAEVEKPGAQLPAEEFSDLPPHHGMTAGQYITTRFSSLKPPMTEAPNPLKLVAMITGRQWAFFFIAFVAWVSPSVPSCGPVVPSC